MRLLPDRQRGSAVLRITHGGLSAHGAHFRQPGDSKVRLTGGEPLLRKGLVELVRERARLKSVGTGEPLDLALTTNGHLLEDLAAPLKDAGLSCITGEPDFLKPSRSMVHIGG